MPYVEHPQLNAPSDDAKIWRYLDFTQFISILERESLYFNRSDKFSDPYEGSIPKPAKNLREQAFQEYSDEWQDIIPEFREICKKNTFLNCWHVNDTESAAMWDIYLKTDEGICIQSTYSDLKNALDGEDRDVYLGLVDYIDYKSEKEKSRSKKSPLGSTVSPFVHKRRSFEHEYELRAIIQDLPWQSNSEPKAELSKDILSTLEAPRDVTNGLYIPVDLDTLISNIHVAPSAPSWIQELLELVTDTYGIGKEVKRSSLERDPVY